MICKIVRWGVAIQWIPSHVNIRGNEIADSLAKHAIDGTITISNVILIKDAFVILNNKLLEKVNLWYRDYVEIEGKGIKFYNFQNVIEKRPWFFNTDLSGTEVRLLNRLLSGHDYSKSWLAKMKLADDPDCEICQEPETAEHVILFCSRFGRIRAMYSFECKFKSLLDLFQSKDLATFKEVVKFLKQIKLEL